MTKQQIEIEIDVPEGFEFVRWGLPNEGEYFMSKNSGCVEKAHHKFTYGGEYCWIILNPTAPELDEELRDKIEFIIDDGGCCPDHHDCTVCEFNCRVKYNVDCCFCDNDRTGLSGYNEFILSIRDKIESEETRIKQQREDEAIELERKRVVGKWCLMWDGENKYIDMVTKYDPESIYPYRVKHSTGYRYAEPLTDTQLTALGLENS